MKAIYVATMIAVGLGVSGQVLADEALAKAKNCMSCHAVDKKLVGPSYKDVAAKYKGDAGAAEDGQQPAAEHREDDLRQQSAAEDPQPDRLGLAVGRGVGVGAPDRGVDQRHGTEDEAGPVDGEVDVGRHSDHAPSVRDLHGGIS